MEQLKVPEPNLLVYTYKFGVTESFLGPHFATDSNQKYRFFDFEVPLGILDFAKTIEGYGGRLLLVGGAVRDAIISHNKGEKVNSKDFDLEIYGLGSEMVEKLVAEMTEMESVDTKGKSFEVLKITLPGTDIEVDISIPRRDSKVDNGPRRSSIKVHGDPSMNVREAAKRRDFVINSMAFDPLEDILYDPYLGVFDIENKTIQVTDKKLFQDDPLRVYRLIQFAARFEYSVDNETLQLCTEMVTNGDLDFLSRERVQEEFEKLLLKARRPSVGFELARRIGLTEKYWPELNALIGVPQEPNWHPEGDVWTHTMQVVDAAAEIAEREHLNKEDKLTLIISALCHDFGKPGTTEYIEGAIRSRGHEQAGVEPSRTFVERVFSDKKARSISDLTKKILPLVAEHLKPKEFWQNEIKRNIDQRRAIVHLSNKLQNGDKKSYPDGGNTNIYMISLLAEADQRGRNPAGYHFKREDVEDLNAWQTWLLEKSKHLKVDQKSPEKILMGQPLMDRLGTKQGGVWVGVVLQSVYFDQLDGLVTTKEQALARALDFFHSYTQMLFLSKGKDINLHSEDWKEIQKLGDPRTALVN